MSNRFYNSTITASGICRFAAIFVLICLFFNAAFARFDGDSSPAGLIIKNIALANYEDEAGEKYQSVSPIVTVTVLAVPAITVTPDETASTATVTPNETVTRYFKICNSGNAEDAFLPVQAQISAPATIAAIYFDTDHSGTITDGDTPVTIGQTATPRLAPGLCTGVLYQIQTDSAAPQTHLTITLQARSTIPTPGTNNFSEDTGTIINAVGNGVTFTSPTNTNLPPVKFVEDLPRAVAAPGQILDYKIIFRNRGGVAAKSVRVVDELPAGLEYVGGTLRLGGHALTDASDADEGTADTRRIELLIPEIAPDAVTDIRFQAKLVGVNSGAGVVNTANVSAANAPSINTSEAVAVVNPLGTVYAGNSGGAVRISGAKVTLAADQDGTAVALESGTGYAPNAANDNPFTTDGNGNFSFVPNENQIGAVNSPVKYFVNVTAPDYRPRSLEVSVSRSSINGNFLTAAIRALDEQPIAVAGGFNLTSQTVEIGNLAALVFNIPMFELSTLQITKSADKQSAEIGDIITYRIQAKNATAYTISNASVRDTLPPSFSYVDGTAELENGGTKGLITPEINGNELVFPIGDLEQGRSVMISYRVRIGANSPEGEQVNLAVISGTQPDGQTITTQPAKAGVRVRGGVFTLRQIVVGRVFEDANLNGKFDAGERPVAGARIYLNNGQSVVTDSAGQYNLPAVNQGSMVLSLDPVTLPQNYYLADDRNRRSSKSWTRLLQTPLGGGGLLRQNFAVAPNDAQSVFAAEEKIIDVNTKTQSVKNAAPSKPLQIASLKNKIPLNAPADMSLIGERSETFTLEATGETANVAAGKVSVLSPQADEVLMSPALSIKARTAKGWTLETTVNGEKIGASNIGETRVDNRNGVTTFYYVGINIKPGENKISLTPVSAEGERGTPEELTVWGRGAVERLELTPQKNQLQAGGREAVAVRIRAFDRWGHPAADGQVAVETSAGHFIVKDQTENPSQTAETARRQAVSLQNGTAFVELSADGASELAHLKAISGNSQAFTEIRITPELRPQLLVGLSELSFGKNAPAIINSGADKSFQSRFSLYFRGQLFNTRNLLTLAYDSQRSLNRLSGRDRTGDFDPLDRAYPIFGDSSQRFEDAQSNSKVYARLDRDNSYAMFGDMETDQQNLQLAGYTRRLTGVKLHLENADGDFVSLTGSRPDTSFARDVFPGGGLSLVRLSHAEVLQGSEVLTLEIRDRRNPELILRRENLIRSVDYNLDSVTGEVFFLRPISAFDYQLNLLQIVAAYEYRGSGAANYVYTGRASKNFRALGLRVGASYVNQRQGEIGAFQIGGLDAEKSLWKGGKLSFETAMTRGRFAAGVNIFDFYNQDLTTTDDAARQRNGMAVRVQFDQSLPFYQSRLKADFSRATENFLNPFGSTVTPGAQRFQFNLEMRPTSRRALTFGFGDERNQTRSVSNSRRTFSFLWNENFGDKFRASVGFDHRVLTDNLTDKTTASNLVTAGAEYHPTEKIELAVKREQNLGDADPTYPDQTTLSANYKLSSGAKLFFTQRLAAAPITPIGDLGGTGFASTGSRRETAFGIETKFARLGAVNGRYQLENGANGVDSFAVIGLQNSWKLNKKFVVEGGFERGFILKGSGASFDSTSVGGQWTPADGFRASARYELRNRNGFGQLLSFGAAGKIGDNWTTLARLQWAKNSFNGRSGVSTDATAAAAYRPLSSDKYAMLFSYNRRSNMQDGTIVNDIRQSAVRDRSDSLSADGLYQVNSNTELYGRFALRFNGNGNTTNAYASAMTMLGQVRVQERLSNNFDAALEGRWLAQANSGTFRRSAGAEIGFWATPDVRFGLGYNFTQTGAANPSATGERQFRGGVYFTITTKLANLFNLFGTSRQGLEADKNVSEISKTDPNKDN